MRFHCVHRFGVLAIYLLAHLGLGACSSSQQQQGEEVEASEGEDGQGESVEGENSNSAEEGGNQAEATEGENYGANGAEAPAEEQTAQEGGEQTGSNLQEMISEMGPNDEAAPPAEAVAETAPAEAAPAAAPEAAPAETAAATPADAPAAAPAAAPAGMGLPEMNSKMPYIVKHGDTLGTIAQKIYGDSSMWKEIKDLTNMHNPSRIYPGDVVYYRLTQQSMAFAQTYENQPKAEITVAQGQTLHSVARSLGDASAWRTIWRLNDQVNNPDELTPGQVIYHYSNVAGASNDKGAANDAVLSSVTTHSHSAPTGNTVAANFLAFASLISANFAG